MSRIWVLAADSAQAVVYTSTGGRAGLSEHRRFDHQDSRKHDRELTTDLPGRAFDSAGQGRHAMEQPTDPKKHEAESFARELGEYLHKACANGDCDKLYVVAPPAFLGLLREQYSKPVQQALNSEIGRHLASLKPDELRSHLPEYL